MARKIKSNKELPLLKNQLRTLSLLIVFLALLTFSPKKSPPLVLPETPAEEVVALHSSSFIPRAEADASHDDYCLTVPVILYHHVQPLYLSTEKQQQSLTVGLEYFDMHMNYLVENGYISLPAESLVRALLNREELPPKSIVVTLDDGYEDNYIYAYPILKKYNIIGNFMISTGLIGKKDYMTWEQLQEMAKDPVVRLYNHTVTHADVGNAPSHVVEQEVRTAHATLTEKIGVPFPLLTYPYGSVSATATATLQKLGFAGAFTTQHGFTQCRSEILELHRDHVGNLPLSSYGL